MRENLYWLMKTTKAIGCRGEDPGSLDWGTTPGLFRYSYLIRLARCCCKRELSLNTIPKVSGRIHVAAIQGRVNQ